MLGRGEEEDRIEPELERGPGLLENRSDHRVDMMAAPLAGIGLFGSEAVPLGGSLALRAGMTMSKSHIKKML